MVQRLMFVLFLSLLAFTPAWGQDTPQTNVTIHVVQRGENLFRIAMQYGTSVEVLTQLNGITLADNVFVGQPLLVPTGTIGSGDQVHLVQPGESLASIAGLYGLTPEALAAQNEIGDQSEFYVGMALIVTPIGALTPESSEIAAPPLVHIVQPGETLFRIATRYGTTVNELATENGIADPETIYAGQQLIIPGVSAPQLALDLPAPVSSFDVFPLILVEGETGRIRLTSGSFITVSGMFLDRALNDAPEADNTRHTMYVGIPVGTAAGVYPITLTLTDAAGAQISLTANVQIVSGGYWRENVNVLADRVNLLDPAIDDAELALLRGIMGNFTPTRYFDAPMGLPAAAPLSSRFGNLRSYNGGAFERTHIGTDFAAAGGAPILATASGRVVMTDMLNVRGVTTVIDHGLGIFTVYCHQTERYVQVGDRVTTGQVIGAVGSSGRVTGAHLHWEVWVNGVPVDPMQWVQQSFS